MIVTLIATALACAIQIATLHILRPSHLVGDEVEYVHSKHAKVHHTVWVRVPLHRAMMRLADSLADNLGAGLGHRGPRVFTSALAICVIGLATGYTEMALGVLPACVVAVMLLASVERAILAIHLWPDLTMGGLWLAAALLMDQPTPASTVLLAVVGGIALGLRIEGAALWAFALVWPMLAVDIPFAERLLSIIIACIFVLVYLSWNRLSHGIWRLDTTVGFNIRAARIDAAGGDITVQAVMQKTLTQHKTRSALPKGVQWWVFLRRVAARLRNLVGPETFVTQCLQSKKGARYQTDSRITQRAPVQFNLLNWFSACFFLMLVVLPLLPRAQISILGLVILIYSSLVTRSRYRMALFPLVAVFGVAGWQQVFMTGQFTALLPGLALAVLLAIVLARAPRLNEIPLQEVRQP